MRGYKEDTVRRNLARWVGRTDRTPQGSVARSILGDLSRDIGLDLVPGILDPIHAARDAA
jgi:hypothetical protein